MSATSLSSSEKPPSEAAPAIEVEGLSASYSLQLDSSSFVGGIRELFNREVRDHRIVPALRNVSFTVERGTVLGVIGRNGAGKSTLLRVIAGILAPEEGRVTVRGQVSALLSMGVGFKTALTGRENIRLGGLAMGISEERLDQITDTIADFAQLGEYIDFPVIGYSSGMKSRLGFSVAAHLDPEVLLIDEALAGGDTKFKQQTSWKMEELCGNGRTIVLVTHGLSTIRSMATTALWLHEGGVANYGEPDEVVQSYIRYCRLEEFEALDED